MEQELPTAFQPLHSFSEGRWLIQGHLLFLPAPRHCMLFLQLFFLTPKMIRLKQWVKLFLQRLPCLSSLHFLCTGRRGTEGKKISTSNIYIYFESTWGGFRPFFARTNTFHPQDDVVRVVESSSQEGFTLCGHQTQADSSVSQPVVGTRVEGTNLPLFVPAPREMGHRRTPCCLPLCCSHPSMKTFPPQIPWCQQPTHKNEAEILFFTK